MQLYVKEYVYTEDNDNINENIGIYWIYQWVIQTRAEGNREYGILYSTRKSVKVSANQPYRLIHANDFFNLCFS